LIDQNEGKHMNAEIDRLKQDLETIEKAVGCGTADRRYFWHCIGYAIAGAFLLLVGAFPNVIPLWPWGKIIFLALFIGLPPLFCRLFVPELPSLYSFSQGGLQSGLPQNFRSLFLTGVMIASLIGFMFWLHKMGISRELLGDVTLVSVGSCFVAWAWQKRWQYSWFVVFGLTLVAIGLVMPFLPHKGVISVIGAGLALGNFIGAIILQRQLKSVHANGKAAH
jgi:hypothetical protein